jgi:broad specificity phosphatase PhoE
MLNELYAGNMEGMSFHDLEHKHSAEFNARQANKLSYRYPGQGGEGYLDVINRLRPVIVELERMTDHCLLITHRTVARILLGYFRGLGRDDVAYLNVPIGMLYSLEPVSYEQYDISLVTYDDAEAIWRRVQRVRVRPVAGHVQAPARLPAAAAASADVQVAAGHNGCFGIAGVIGNEGATGIEGVC